MYKFMKLRLFMMSDTLYVILYIPLVDKSLQCNLYRIHIIPLGQPLLKNHLNIQYRKNTSQLDQMCNIFHFLVISDILSCQVSNGQFCCINSLLYSVDTSSSCNYALFLQNKDRINKFCTLSMVNQMQDGAFNISDNLWSISTLHDNKKVYISCFQFSYLIKLYFPYYIVYLPSGCEANAVTSILPSNNNLNVEPINEPPKIRF